LEVRGKLFVCPNEQALAGEPARSLEKQPAEAGIGQDCRKWSRCSIMSLVSFR
jgi:hypothetical protein